MWVDYEPVNMEIDDDNLRIFHVFEMQIEMNEFYHRILAVQFLMFLCLVLLCAHCYCVPLCLVLLCAPTVPLVPNVPLFLCD